MVANGLLLLGVGLLGELISLLLSRVWMRVWGMSMGYGYDGLVCVWCLGLLALD